MTQPEEFSISFDVRWADLDANNHVRNSAYLDYSVDVRMQFFAQAMFQAGEYAIEKLGPAVLREELIYKREIRANNKIRVDLWLAGLSPDAARWKMITNIYADGALAAVVTAEGGWLDLEKRKLRLPSERIAAAIAILPRTGEFEELKGLSK